MRSENSPPPPLSLSILFFRSNQRNVNCFTRENGKHGDRDDGKRSAENAGKHSATDGGKSMVGDEEKTYPVLLVMDDRKHSAEN